MVPREPEALAEVEGAVYYIHACLAGSNVRMARGILTEWADWGHFHVQLSSGGLAQPLSGLWTCLRACAQLVWSERLPLEWKCKVLVLWHCSRGEPLQAVKCWVDRGGFGVNFWGLFSIAVCSPTSRCEVFCHCHGVSICWLFQKSLSLKWSAVPSHC